MASISNARRPPLEQITALMTIAGGKPPPMRLSTGSAPGRCGFAVGCMTMFSWEMVGSQKTMFSGGAAGTTQNHPSFAAMASICEGDANSCFMREHYSVV